LTSLPVLVFDIGGRDASVFSHDSFTCGSFAFSFPGCLGSGEKRLAGAVGERVPEVNVKTAALAGLPISIVLDFGRLTKWAVRAPRTAAGAAPALAYE